MTNEDKLVNCPVLSSPSNPQDNDKEMTSLVSPQEAILDDMLERMGPLIGDYLLGNSYGKTSVTDRYAWYMQQSSVTGNLDDAFERAVVQESRSQNLGSGEQSFGTANTLMEMERRVAIAYHLHGKRFPPQIWTCCKKACFTLMATDANLVSLFHEILRIHEHAERHHAAVENESNLIERRRKGIGTSTVAFTAPSRAERESLLTEDGTRRQQALKRLARFVGEVLPFLYGLEKSPSGVDCPRSKLCTESIHCILGVSRNFLYYRKKNTKQGTEAQYLNCLVDEAGLRMQQHRRMQNRDGFPKVEQLPTFECGCEVPCFVDVPELLLLSEYEEFSKLSRELKPRHKENQYLLNRMYIPLSNSTTHVCIRALANLYTVSKTFITDVRGVLNQICEDPSIEKRALLNDGSLRYKYSETHPLRKFSSRERQKIEDSLNLVLRADPAGGVNGTVCRVYSPEVNTQEKLKAVLLQELQLDSECKWDMSSSTLRRMIQDYLKRRNIKSISFTQSDHNACPTCKTMHYAVLQYHHEAKILYQELLELDKNGKKNTPAFHRKREELIKQVRDKEFQEEECLREMQVHTSRDKRIRHKIKELVDYFRRVENDSRAKLAELTKEQLIALQNMKAEWNSLPGRACMTHQDDMTKVDLPHFFLSASSDITRWRFDVNAHVNAVTQDAVVFSHEQGTGPKNASAIIEEILLEHLLSCRGESIKIVVSDNASVERTG